MGKWSNLTAKQKAAIIRFAIDNGVSDIKTIRDTYDIYAKDSLANKDYDMGAARAAGFKPDSRKHYPDAFKKPNHPTFSTESIYHPENTPGGAWEKLNGNWTYTPSEYVLQQHGWNGFLEGFRNQEGSAAYTTSYPTYEGGVMLPEVDVYPTTYKDGGKIHIAPSKKGTFTAAATKHGKSVQAFASQVLANKENYSPAMVRKAVFAHNSKAWKHSTGGPLYPFSFSKYPLPAVRYDNGGDTNRKVTKVTAVSPAGTFTDFRFPEGSRLTAVNEGEWSNYYNSAINDLGMSPQEALRFAEENVTYHGGLKQDAVVWGKQPGVKHKYYKDVPGGLRVHHAQHTLPTKESDLSKLTAAAIGIPMASTFFAGPMAGYAATGTVGGTSVGAKDVVNFVNSQAGKQLLTNATGKTLLGIAGFEAGNELSRALTGQTVGQNIANTTENVPYINRIPYTVREFVGDFANPGAWIGGKMNVPKVTNKILSVVEKYNPISNGNNWVNNFNNFVDTEAKPLLNDLAQFHKNNVVQNPGAYKSTLIFPQEYYTDIVNTPIKKMHTGVLGYLRDYFDWKLNGGVSTVAAHNLGTTLNEDIGRAIPRAIEFNPNLRFNKRTVLDPEAILGHEGEHGFQVYHAPILTSENAKTVVPEFKLLTDRNYTTITPLQKAKSLFTKKPVLKKGQISEWHTSPLEFDAEFNGRWRTKNYNYVPFSKMSLDQQINAAKFLQNRFFPENPNGVEAFRILRSGAKEGYFSSGGSL